MAAYLIHGYTTGVGTGIRWTAADFAAHPGAVRIDQDPAASDPTADALIAGGISSGVGLRIAHFGP